MWPFIQRPDLVEKPVTTKVIEFYVPKNFRSPRKLASETQLGRIIEFRLPAKSASGLVAEMPLCIERSAEQVQR
jgi:hypothetical protein